MGLRDWLSRAAERFARELKKASVGESIGKLAEAHAQNDLVLVLGAGASASYGLPSWDALVQGLLIAVQGDGGEGAASDQRDLAELFNEVFDPGPLIAARYVRNAIEGSSSKARDEAGLEEKIRELLYADPPADDFESELMKEIRKLCAAPGGMPTLDAIITYNYDDILERCLARIDLDIPFAPIYAVGQRPAIGQLPIYHVHGYLPRDGRIGEDHRITLAEESYHDQYLDVYSWKNMVQINKFRDRTCLFLGISLTDPNQRRVLDIACKQRGDEDHRHFLVRKKETVEGVREQLDELGKAKPTARSAARNTAEPAPAEQRLQENVKAIQQPGQASSESAPDVAESLVDLMHAFYESDAESFGISTIWVDDHDEIPGILNSVRERNTPGK